MVGWHLRGARAKEPAGAVPETAIGPGGWPQRARVEAHMFQSPGLPVALGLTLSPRRVSAAVAYSFSVGENLKELFFIIDFPII